MLHPAFFLYHVAPAKAGPLATLRYTDRGPRLRGGDDMIRSRPYYSNAS